MERPMRKLGKAEKWQCLYEVIDREGGNWRFHRSQSVFQDSDGKWYYRRKPNRLALWIIFLCWRRRTIPMRFSNHQQRAWDALAKPTGLGELVKETGLDLHDVNGMLFEWLALGLIWAEWKSS
jgi:hypothetical protein